MRTAFATLGLAALLLVNQEGVSAENGALERGEIKKEERKETPVLKANGGSRFKSRSDAASTKEHLEEDAQGGEEIENTGAGVEGKASKRKKKKGATSQEELECEREDEGKPSEDERSGSEKEGGKKKKTKKGGGSKFGKDAKRKECKRKRDYKSKTNPASTLDAEAAAKKLREQHEKRTADGLSNATKKRNNAMKSLDAIAPEIGPKKVDEGAVNLGEGDRIGDL